MMQQQRRALRSADATTPRASRHAKPTTSYREPSSDIESQTSRTETLIDSDSSTHELSSQARSAHQRSHRTAPSKSRRQPFSPRAVSTSIDTVYQTRKRKWLPDRRASRQFSKTKAVHIHTAQQDHYSSSAIPPWASLPYEVLVQIFQYASCPLCDERTFQALPSVDWLLKTSRLCHAFTEPALTALYRSPPLAPMEKAHKLRNLVASDPEPLSYNYRAKIERLQIEVLQTAAYTLPGSGLLDLHGLIYYSPRLLDLELYHQKDFSPYRKLDDSIKWTYPDSLFVALNCNVSGNPTKLRSWRWSARLAGKKRPIESLLDIHQNPSFRSLRKIAFVNYQKVRIRKNAEDPQHEKWLAASLRVLLGLEHLIFESSTLLNSILLPLLPKNLKRLEIINCSEVDSHDLSTFLISHGSNLRALTLNHNISLNLSFLKVLGSSCSRLESLRMNLTYYNTHSAYQDSDPRYGHLLGIDEKPHWPATLQIIEFTQLRRWDIDIAKMFFQSLLENANNLANLRRLVIKAILNTSWRDRSSFRDEWVGSFERVFKRPFIPPNLYVRPRGVCIEYKNPIETTQVNVKDGVNSMEHQPLKIRRLTVSGERRRRRLGLERTLQLPNDDYLAVRNDQPLTMVQSYGREEESHSSDDQPLIMRRSTRLIDVPSKAKGPPSDLQDIQSSPRGIPERGSLGVREKQRKQVLSRELEILRKTAGADGPSQSVYSNAPSHNYGIDYGSDSDDVPLVNRRHTSTDRKKAEHIQGMCEVVSITIDNLRPSETQFVEADFLDSEPEGDEDWDGSEELPGDARYAW